MKFKDILPYLIPVVIAIGLIVYNEKSDNVLLSALNVNESVGKVENPVLEPTNNENKPNTDVVKEDNLNNPRTITLENEEVLSVDENSVTISNNQHEIAINDIIVVGVLDNAPYGFLRKVIGVSNIEETIVLETEKATLIEAYSNEIVNENPTTETQGDFNYTFKSSDLVKN